MTRLMDSEQFATNFHTRLGYPADAVVYDKDTDTLSVNGPAGTLTRSAGQLDQALGTPESGQRFVHFIVAFLDAPKPTALSDVNAEEQLAAAEAGAASIAASRAFDQFVEKRKQSILVDREARRQIAVEEMGLGDLSERWLDLAALEALEPPSYLIDRKVPDHSVGYITGRDGTYKTFLALDFALTLAARGEKVVYLVGEGANGFASRIGAWLAHHAVDRAKVAENLIVRNGTVNLFAQGPDFANLLEKVSETMPKLVVVDTLARSIAGADESSNSDMSLVTKGLDALKEASGGTVLVIAHTDKGDNDARGASAIEDNADFVLHNVAKGGEIRVTVEKMKDGSRGERFDFVPKGVGSSVVLVPPTQADVKAVASSHDLDNRVMVILKSFAALDLGASLPDLVSELKKDSVGETRDRITKHTVSDVLKALRNDGYVRRSPEVGNTNVKFYATPKQWRHASNDDFFGGIQ